MSPKKFLTPSLFVDDQCSAKFNLFVCVDGMSSRSESIDSALTIASSALLGEAEGLRRTHEQESKLYDLNDIQSVPRKGFGILQLFVKLYTIYLSLCTQTADSKYSEPFSKHTLYIIYINLYSILYQHIPCYAHFLATFYSFTIPIKKFIHSNFIRQVNSLKFLIAKNVFSP